MAVAGTFARKGPEFEGKKTRKRLRPTKRQRAERTAGFQRRKTATVVKEGRLETQREQTRQFAVREEVRRIQSSRRIREREAAIGQRQRESIGIRRSERLQRRIEEPAANTAQPAINSLIFVGMVMAGLVVLYLLVTTPLTGFLGGLGNVIGSISQTGSLFSKVPTS